MIYFYLFGVWFVFTAIAQDLKASKKQDIELAFWLSLFSWLTVAWFLLFMAALKVINDSRENNDKTEH